MQTTRLDPMRLERSVSNHEVDVAAARVMQHADLLYQAGRIIRARGLAMAEAEGSSTTVNCAAVFERRDCKKVLIDGSLGGVVRITPGRVAACHGPLPQWEDDAENLDVINPPAPDLAPTEDSVETLATLTAGDLLALNTFDLSAYLAPGAFGPYAGSSTRIWRLIGLCTASGIIDAEGTAQILASNYPDTFSGFGGDVTVTFTWGTKIYTIFTDSLFRQALLQRGYTDEFGDHWPS